MNRLVLALVVVAGCKDKALVTDCEAVAKPTRAYFDKHHPSKAAVRAERLVASCKANRWAHDAIHECSQSSPFTYDPPSSRCANMLSEAQRKAANMDVIGPDTIDGVPGVERFEPKGDFKQPPR